MADRVPVSLSMRYSAAIEDELHRWLEMRPRVGIHYQMLAYHMGWLDQNLTPTGERGGKRFRPLLCLLSAEAVGGEWQQALPLAAAIEFLHNFSLIHDDIEDHDETRRYRPTLWALWGDPQAINAGDAMLALAGLTALYASTEPVTAVRLARRLQETALALTEGQHLDMSFERSLDVSVDDYLRMISLKTAALIAFSCEAGAVLGHGTEIQVTALHAFGENLGMAFQIDDDIRGIWSPAEQTGKAQGKDILNRKKTLPILHAFERAQGEMRETLTRYYHQTTAIDPGEIILILDTLSVRSEVEATRQRYLDRAVAQLRQAALAEHSVEQLATLASALVEA
jgi:geranylgeranyl diphosphate synthase type I